MSRIFAAVTILCLCLVGCAGQPGPTPTTPVPSESAPGSSTPTATPSEPVTPEPSATATPSVPPVEGALDVSRYRNADFASPSGNIWCGLDKDGALCNLPVGFKGKIPSEKKVCPGTHLIVSSVFVDAKGTDWMCSGDTVVSPTKGEPSVAWHKNTGFGFTKTGDVTVAMLPYGTSLRHGDTVCRSERTGITCGNRATGHGFALARAGVVFF